MFFSHVIVFSRMRSKGYRFTLGVWVRVCSLDAAFTTATVCNRPQPFATVEGRMAMPCHAYVKFCQRGHFWKFQLSRCCVSRAWQAWHFVALRGIQTCFVTCGKSFCVAATVLLRRFQKMRCIFPGRRNTLETIIVILRGRCSTLDVSCGSFCANRNVRAA